MISILKSLIKFNYNRTIRSVLIGRNRDRTQWEKGRFTHGDTHRIIENSWEHFILLQNKIPRHKTFGNRLMVRNGVFTLSLYKALLPETENIDYAVELTTDVIWQFYVKALFPYRLIARALTRDPQKQIRIIMQMDLKLIFNRPGYQYKIHDTSEGIAIDFLKCPVYEFFKSIDDEALHLFQRSWCTLDYPIAQVLADGGRYERTLCLSHGDSMCDMRFIV